MTCPAFWTCLGPYEVIGSLFSNHIAGVFVAADARETRMTQSILRRPFQVDADDDERLQPAAQRFRCHDGSL
jgi:hypothetical protein